MKRLLILAAVLTLGVAACGSDGTKQAKIVPVEVDENPAAEPKGAVTDITATPDQSAPTSSDVAASRQTATTRLASPKTGATGTQDRSTSTTSPSVSEVASQPAKVTTTTIPTVQFQMVDNNADISAMKSQISAMQSDISSLKSTDSSTVNRISSLESQLSSMKTKLDRAARCTVDLTKWANDLTYYLNHPSNYTYAPSVGTLNCSTVGF